MSSRITEKKKLIVKHSRRVKKKKPWRKWSDWIYRFFYFVQKCSQLDNYYKAFHVLFESLLLMGHSKWATLNDHHNEIFNSIWLTCVAYVYGYFQLLDMNFCQHHGFMKLDKNILNVNITNFLYILAKFLKPKIFSYIHKSRIFIFLNYFIIYFFGV